MKILLTLLIVAIANTHSTAQKTAKETLYFDHNKADLSVSSKSELDETIQKIKGKNIAQIKISGYTDNDGSDTYNTTLSQKRALTVLNYLVTKEFDKKKIKIGCYGEQQAVATNDDSKGKQQNRRVDILIEFVGFSVPKGFTVGYQKLKINPNKDTIIKINSRGTLLHVQANSFVDQRGKPVKETVTLNFREYKNSAEIAFSDITMIYTNEEGEFRFNSSGMFELTGTVNEEPVEIKKGKGLKIDYALAKKNHDISFFRLNDEKNNWEKIQDIKPNKRKIYDKLVFWSTTTKLINGLYVEEKVVDSIFYGDDPGHIYPLIIAGLSIVGFGVYNCDQIYRLPNPVAITAKYVDFDGKEIENLNVVSLIDLEYNGAFSFDPHNFICDAKGQNVLALFTKKGQLYLLDKLAFTKMNISKDGEYTFKMKNCTDKIKNSKDLAAYLGIKI